MKYTDNQERIKNFIKTDPNKVESKIKGYMAKLRHEMVKDLLFKKA